MQKLMKLPYLLSIGLLIYMPFHIFLSQWLSTYTGYLDFWKVAKDVVLVFGIILTVGLIYISRGFKDRSFWLFSGLAGLYFLLHLLIWQVNPDTADEPALLATAYNCRLLGFAILGWGAGLLSKKHIKPRQIFQVVIAVSTIVCIFGIIQYNLPKDFMEHFGYSLERGVKPNFFIDDKPDLPRIMSTLRDPNSLGAYLILPITLLVGAWLKKPRLRMLLSGLLLLHFLALLLTFGRGAWLGALLAVSLITIWHFKDKTKSFVKKYWPALLAGLFVIILGVFLLRDQYFVQNVVFHSDENTQLTDSNNLRLIFMREGLEQIADQPWGYGPGTAGLVSIQTDKVVLTENYFIQIGHEIGLLGLGLLIYLMYFIISRLYRVNSLYSRSLIASFFGITVCAMLLLIWSNEAVAAQWWILAGLILGLDRRNSSGPGVG